MADFQKRIDYLISNAWNNDELTTDERQSHRDEVVRILVEQPQFDAYLMDRYLTRHVEEWEIRQACRILSGLGDARPYDLAPLFERLPREDVSQSFKYDVLFCITQAANFLDEGKLFVMLESLPPELRTSGICKTIDALDLVRDRGKATRLLKQCLAATDTTDEETMMFLLDNFVNRVNGNEDIFKAVLRETQTPHEIVLMAVSMMRESLPVGSEYRRIADEAAGQSELADTYYNLYVGVYVAQQNPLDGL